MGVDIHEKRRLEGKADRNPNWPVMGLARAPGWVQNRAAKSARIRKIKGEIQGWYKE